MKSQKNPIIVLGILFALMAVMTILANAWLAKEIEEFDQPPAVTSQPQELIVEKAPQTIKTKSPAVGSANDPLSPVIAQKTKEEPAVVEDSKPKELRKIYELPDTNGVIFVQ